LGIEYSYYQLDPQSTKLKQAVFEVQDGGATGAAAVPVAARFPPGGGMNKGRYVWIFNQYIPTETGDLDAYRSYSQY